VTGGAGFTIGTAPGGVHPVATRVVSAGEDFIGDVREPAGAVGASSCVRGFAGAWSIGLGCAFITTELGFAAANAAIARGFVNGITLGGVVAFGTREGATIEGIKPS